MWELDALADLFERLSQFSRLVLHDRRATGLSGGGRFPNLETRARDLLTVLDTIRSSRTVLLRRAHYRCRLHGLRSELSRTELRRSCGTGQSRRGDGRPSTRGARHRTSIARRSRRCETGWAARSSPVRGSRAAHRSLAGDDRLAAQIARLDRHFMAPSTAAEWIQVESETDVTAVLPLLRCPTLVLDYEQSSTDAAQSRHVQSRIPGAQLQLISGDPYALPYGDRAQIVEAVKAFVGRERPTEAPETVLGNRSVHRHRRVDRAPGGSRRPRVGGRDSSSPRNRSRGTGAMAGRRERHGGRRLLRNVRRPRPCYSLRARHRESSRSRSGSRSARAFTRGSARSSMESEPDSP